MWPGRQIKFVFIIIKNVNVLVNTRYPALIFQPFDATMQHCNCHEKIAKGFVTLGAHFMIFKKTESNKEISSLLLFQDTMFFVFFFSKNEVTISSNFLSIKNHLVSSVKNL